MLKNIVANHFLKKINHIYFYVFIDWAGCGYDDFLETLRFYSHSCELILKILKHYQHDRYLTFYSCYLDQNNNYYTWIARKFGKICFVTNPNESVSSFAKLNILTYSNRASNAIKTIATTEFFCQT
jgi:hypothetical protein